MGPEVGKISHWVERSDVAFAQQQRPAITHTMALVACMVRPTTAPRWIKISSRAGMTFLGVAHQ